MLYQKTFFSEDLIHQITSKYQKESRIRANHYPTKSTELRLSYKNRKVINHPPQMKVIHLVEAHDTLHPPRASYRCDLHGPQ